MVQRRIFTAINHFESSFTANRTKLNRKSRSSTPISPTDWPSIGTWKTSGKMRCYLETTPTTVVVVGRLANFHRLVSFWLHRVTGALHQPTPVCCPFVFSSLALLVLSVCTVTSRRFRTLPILRWPPPNQPAHQALFETTPRAHTILHIHNHQRRFQRVHMEPCGLDMSHLRSIKWSRVLGRLPIRIFYVSCNS